MKLLILPVLILFASAELAAQGFNAFSGRNHPELNWQVAETEHFLIMYPNRISGIETEAAAIAEESYRALSENFGVEFSDKIRVYLSDEDEVNNGFAVPIGKGYTNIWVNTNDYSEYWTGREKWLRKVLAHELGHIFHYKAIWSNMGLWQFAVGTPLTRTWTEGLAQYQTEQWDSERGDRWLRKAIFDSRPNYFDNQAIENPRLMYAAGNSQLRYFTEKYGDSTLVEMLSKRKPFLGLFERHDFYDAFSEIVDGGYEAFYEDWRKHMNVYYNSLAANMERVDSLNAELISLPGQFYYDMALSPDDSQIAVLSLTSMQRQVRRLFVVQNDTTLHARLLGEGGINPDISWSSDGSKIYYSGRARGEHSSIVNDIFELDVKSGNKSRLTYSRRARYPIAGPENNQISYIVNEDGTGNLFTLNLETKEEERITGYTSDIQLLWPLWIPNLNSWLVHRFDEIGLRHLVLIERETLLETVLDLGEYDNRKMVLSPDGNQIAYTSLRDEVPNVFVYDFENETEERITNLFTGGELHGWMAETDTLVGERLLVEASETKRWDGAYWVPRNREVFQPQFSVSESYSSWRNKRPPSEIPAVIEPDEYLVLERYRYNSFRNLTHAATIALPYYAGPTEYGLFATTNWVEPLGKHAITGLGWLSVVNPAENSFGVLSYVNNQFYPSLIFSLYRTPGNGRFYGDRFLVENLTGGDITARWPIDRLDAPYQSGSIDMRLRHIFIDPFARDRFEESQGLPLPESGRQTDLQIGWQVKKQRPWRYNTIHPLDGYGLRLAAKGAERILASDVQFLTIDLNSYSVIPAIGMHRIFAQFRAQAQWGNPLPQDFIGFSRYDNISLNLPGEVPLNFLMDSERVRGYRDFVAGRQVIFGSLEYRIPFLPSLQTTILGFLQFGSSTISLFTDAGVVWDAHQDDGTSETERRWGSGAEIKNEVQLFGIGFSHAVGLAQPTQNLFEDDFTDLYYRFRAVVPF